MLFEGFGLAALILAVCVPADHPLLAEVFYDATGDDGGREFVELFNPAAAPVPLAGLRLEAGDGAAPGRWTLCWTGQSGDTIAPRGRYVVGGALVTPAPQAVAVLGLQNGPDAVRLVWPDGAIETVGYGALDSPEYFCTAPAADVLSGQSLARVPDASDAGSNALDFRAAAPSPGRANRPDRDVAWIAGSLALDPEQPASGATARLRGAIVNLGAGAIGPRDARIEIRTSGAFGDRDVSAMALEAGLAPAESAAAEVPLPALVDGKQTLACRLVLAGDDAPENDLDSLRVRVGPGPLEFTEIQFHPAHGEGEWVELRNRSDDALEPGGFTLSDRGGSPGRPSDGELACDPESLVVFAKDRVALLARYARLDPRRVWQVSPWASLNNSDDSSGVADVLALREADGTPCARVAYSAAGVPAGVPIERAPDGSWRAAPDPDGTPLLPPRPSLAVAGRFELSPRRLRAGIGRARVAWSLPWARSRVQVEIYDLAGTRVASPLPETPVAGTGEREWNAAVLPAGVYLVVLRARPESGGESLSESRVLRVDGVER